jgi:hypothetical protein
MALKAPRTFPRRRTTTIAGTKSRVAEPKSTKKKIRKEKEQHQNVKEKDKE